MRAYFQEILFDKDRNSITELDLIQFFQDEQYETSTLEFKSGDIEIDSIYKEVAAFLNTEGGLIILGTPKEQNKGYKKDNIKYCQGMLTPSKFKSQGWISQKIVSNITPSPTDIYIKEIPINEGKIFLIDIPQSMNPPHQCNGDGRYYIRVDSEARPAPHGLIQALFNKRKVPKLTSRIERENGELANLGLESIKVSILNESNIPADKVSCMIDIFDASIDYENDQNQFKKSIIKDNKFKYSQIFNFPHVLVRVISGELKIELRMAKSEYVVSVSVWSKDTDYDCTIFLINKLENTIKSISWLDGKDIIEKYYF